MPLVVVGAIRTKACLSVISFFFQAEDGIRYWSVTGVQTCALPIFGLEADTKPLKDVAAQIRVRLEAEATEKAMQARAQTLRRELLAAQDFAAAAKGLGLRSEERRVGKEGRARGRPEV